MLRDASAPDYRESHPLTGLAAIEIPEMLSNEIEVREDDETIVYRAEISDIHFEALGMACTSRIGRIKQETILIPVFHRPYRWQPWRKELLRTDEQNKKVWAWSVMSGSNKLIISGVTEKVAKDRKWGCYYRGALVDVAANQRGVILPDQLLETLFAPIDQEVLRLWHRVKKV